MSRFPVPVEILSPSSSGIARLPLVMLCEHADKTIPPHLNNLGLHGTDLTRHIAWDIGIGNVVRLISARQGIEAALAMYSRLIIDCNRPLTHPELFWPFEDGTMIPGNQNLSAEDKDERLHGIYLPYHEAAQNLVDRAITQFGEDRLIVLNMHSFTPERRDGFGGPRPWEVCLSTCKPRGEDGAMERLADLLEQEGIIVGRHKPFDTRGSQDGTHCHAARTQQILIELRQDLIDTQDDQMKWAEILSSALMKLCAT